MGVIAGTADGMKTKNYTGDALKFAHKRLSEAFDNFMDGLAENDRTLSHVYEWDRQGIGHTPGDRLWKHTLTGSGKTRTASWTWRASVKPIPTPTERYEDPDNDNDAIKGVRREIIDKLSERAYVFHWKAPVMEYGTTITSQPVYAQMLFIPTRNRARGYDLKSSNTANPGKAAGTVGRFTETWTSWWASMSGAEFDKHVKPVLEDRLASAEQGIRQGQRLRSKGAIGIRAATDYEKAMAAGHEWAYQNLQGRSFYESGGFMW
jgi:hypothetical protein